MFRIPCTILLSWTTFSRPRSVRSSESLLCCPPAVSDLVLFYSDWSMKDSQDPLPPHPPEQSTVNQIKSKQNRPTPLLKNYSYVGCWIWNWVYPKLYICRIRKFQNHFLLHQNFFVKVSLVYGEIDGQFKPDLKPDLNLQRSWKMNRSMSGPQMKLGYMYISGSSNRHSLNHPT